MATSDGYGYGRAFARLAARWQFAGDRLRDAHRGGHQRRRGRRERLGRPTAAYQRFLGRLGAVASDAPDESPGAVALFALTLRLQAQATPPPRRPRLRRARRRPRPRQP
jgi:hypothetical protein